MNEVLGLAAEYLKKDEECRESEREREKGEMEGEREEMPLTTVSPSK